MYQQVDMIVLAVTFNQFCLVIPTDFGKNVAKVADSRLRQHITAVFRNEDQVDMQHVNDMSSRFVIHICYPWENCYAGTMIHRGYRFKLKPTPEQERLFSQFAGVCRLIYNLALDQRRTHWRAFKRQTGNSISYEYDWISVVSQTCQQQALRDLDRACQNWFKGLAKYPSPRKKGLNDTFRFHGREVQVRKLTGKWSEVRLPKIGWVRFRDTRQLRG